MSHKSCIFFSRHISLGWLRKPTWRCIYVGWHSHRCIIVVDCCVAEHRAHAYGAFWTRVAYSGLLHDTNDLWSVTPTCAADVSQNNVINWVQRIADISGLFPSVPVLVCLCLLVFAWIVERNAAVSLLFCMLWNCRWSVVGHYWLTVLCVWFVFRGA